MSDDGLPEGPYCPTCGGELGREPIATETAIVVAFACSEHGAFSIVSPFD